MRYKTTEDILKEFSKSAKYRWYRLFGGWLFVGWGNRDLLSYWSRDGMLPTNANGGIYIIGRAIRKSSWQVMERA